MTTNTNTMKSLHEASRDHELTYAYGSESSLYQAFVADCDSLDLCPWDEEDQEIVMDEDFYRFWIAMFDHDWATAAWYGYVDPDHVEEYACEHCAKVQALNDCNDAEYIARWHDAEGNVAEETTRICPECLDQSAEVGFGYTFEGTIYP